MTSEDAACGFIGFLVVFALRKATAPETLNATPTAARTRAIAMRTEGSSAAGARRAIPHMASATSSATTGGGIFSSREDIATFLWGWRVPAPASTAYTHTPWQQISSQRRARCLVKHRS